MICIQYGMMIVNKIFSKKYIPKRIENGSTISARTDDRIITDWWQVWSFFQWSVKATHRNHLVKEIIKEKIE